MRQPFDPDKASGPLKRGNPNSGLSHEEVTSAIIGAAVSVHKSLGPSLLESAYEACLAHEIGKCGLLVQRQVDLPIVYERISTDCGYRMDLVVERKVLVELKAVDRIAPIHEAQLNTYMRLSTLRVGLMINFNSLRLTDGIVRRIL